jgi:hypothetical protein
MTGGKKRLTGPKAGKRNYPLRGVLEQEGFTYHLLKSSTLLKKNPRSKNIKKA